MPDDLPRRAHGIRYPGAVAFRWVAVATATAILLACGPSTASPKSPTAPTAPDRPAGDERQLHAIDGRVVGRTNDQGKVKFAIGLPKGTEPGTVDAHWTGVFTADGKELPGTGFMLTMAWVRDIRAEIAGDVLPSMTVRLFPPGYRH